MDIKALLAPKKKKGKKKEPKFVIPDWAVNYPDMSENIKSLEELLKSAKELDFHDDFIKDAKESIDRMKKELKYRKALDEE